MFDVLTDVPERVRLAGTIYFNPGATSATPLEADLK